MSVVWVHTPSVGEYVTAKPLLEYLKERGHRLVVTYSSPRAEEFMKKQSLADRYLHLPISGLLLGFSVKLFVRRYKPNVLLLVESDRYPSLLGAKVPTKLLINARLGRRSYKLLKALKGIYQPLLSRFDAIVCKDRETAERFGELGVSREKLSVCGNLKAVFKPNLKGSNISFPSHKRVLVAGSTHKGEEEIILSAFGRIKRELPDTVLVLAPRHPSRASEVYNLARKIHPNLETSLRSEAGETFKGDILVVDTLGELLHFYRLSTVSFVGGSLVPIGGHNLLEPAYFGKPVMFGTHIGKFKDLVQILEGLGLAFPVRDEKEFTQTALRLLRNPPTPKGDLISVSNRILECYKGVLDRWIG